MQPLTTPLPTNTHTHILRCNTLRLRSQNLTACVLVCGIASTSMDLPATLKHYLCGLSPVVVHRLVQEGSVALVEQHPCSSVQEQTHGRGVALTGCQVQRCVLLRRTRGKQQRKSTLSFLKTAKVDHLGI